MQGMLCVTAMFLKMVHMTLFIHNEAARKDEERKAH